MPGRTGSAARGCGVAPGPWTFSCCPSGQPVGVAPEIELDHLDAEHVAVERVRPLPVGDRDHDVVETGRHGETVPPRRCSPTAGRRGPPGTIEVGVSKNRPRAVRVDGRRAVAREERRDLLLRLEARTSRPPGRRRSSGTCAGCGSRPSSPQPRGRSGRASSATARLPARMIADAVGFGTVLSPRANWMITGAVMNGA